jgi:predicted cupin superfamily sugar epimerase
MLDAVTHSGTKSLLGPDFSQGQRPQLVVPAQACQGAHLAPGPQVHGWALLGCTMSPGWDEREFALGERVALLARFPGWATDIFALTR